MCTSVSGVNAVSLKSPNAKSPIQADMVYQTLCWAVKGRVHAAHATAQTQSKSTRIQPHTPARRLLLRPFPSTLPPHLHLTPRPLTSSPPHLLAPRYALKAETALLVRLDHPNLVLVDTCVDTLRTFYIVEELMEGGELFDRVAARRRFTERDAARVVGDLARGVAYVRDSGCCYVVLCSAVSCWCSDV